MVEWGNCIQRYFSPSFLQPGGSLSGCFSKAMNEKIYDNLLEFGIKFWIRDGELYFKYPEGLEGEGGAELFKFIKGHEEGIKRRIESGQKRRTY